MDYNDFEGYIRVHPDKRKHLRDARGQYRTESSFIEVIQGTSKDKYTPEYSLKDYDNRGYISAYQVYMHSVDETEAAMKLFGSLAHWRKLCGLKWFINGRKEHGFEGLASWREDMAARDKTLAKRVLLKQCENGNVTAARSIDKMAGENRTPANSKDAKRSLEVVESSAVTSLLDRFGTKDE
jgi:hypothetical protein